MSPLPPVTLTFGHYTQAEPWSDRRTMPWEDLARLLTTHVVGPKEGTCVVPAVFSGAQRKKAEAVQIDVAMLDSDSGATLDEITASITARGWAAIIASTHSHLTTQTTVKQAHWLKHLEKHGTGTPPEHYLIHEKGMLSRVAAGAALLTTVQDHAVFRHGPCPKFRIAIPLLRPWVAASYDGQKAANAAWKERIEALAAALGLQHDQACTDTSRLFYLPRRLADGPPPEAAVLAGRPCDIFALPEPDGDPSPGPTRARQRRRSEDAGFTDPETGEEFDARSWVRRFGQRFLIVKALRARQPAVLVGKLVDGTRHHIRCPNEDEHSQSGEDAATFVCDAGASTEAKGFVIHCRHGHCDGRDRLFFLRRMLEQGWLRIADLTNPDFLSGDAPVRPLIRIAGGEIADVVDKAEAALLEAGLDLYQRGPMIVRPGLVRVTISDGREISGQRAIPVEQHAMAEAMTQAATWEKFDCRSESWVQIDAPAKVAMTYLQRAGRWRLIACAGTRFAPCAREAKRI